MAVDYFLDLSGIEGESQNTKFKNKIQILTWSWGASNVSSVGGTGGSGAGKVDMSDVSLMINLDKSTSKFFRSICLGSHILSGTLSAVKSGAGGEPYLIVNFSEVFITNLQMSASSEAPSVSLSFTYNTIGIDYKMQGGDGIVKSVGEVKYNVTENKVS